MIISIIQIDLICIWCHQIVWLQIKMLTGISSCIGFWLTNQFLLLFLFMFQMWLNKYRAYGAFLRLITYQLPHFFLLLIKQYRSFFQCFLLLFQSHAMIVLTKWHAPLAIDRFTKWVHQHKIILKNSIYIKRWTYRRFSQKWIKYFP